MDDFKKQWTIIGKELIESANCNYFDSKDLLVEMGSKLWQYSYNYTDDDIEAFTRIVKHFMDEQSSIAVAAGSPDIQVLLSWASRWADQAFPQIILGHKIAAAMMATSVNVDVSKEIHAPWKAFLIQIPKGLITLRDHKAGTIANMDLLGVQEFSRRTHNTWNWRLSSTESPLQLWRFGLPSEKLVDADIGFSDDYLEDLFGKSIDDMDERVSQLIGRLIISICLSFPEHGKSIGSGSKSSYNKRGFIVDRNGFPIVRNYEIRTPIRIDCRENIKNYIRTGKTNLGGSTVPTVQYLVRGYWRRPPHGIERNVPKNVWVHPHWKGPEDAKILVRGHKVIEE